MISAYYIIMRPLKFKTILKQTIWGGDRILSLKHLDCNIENVGESWEISGVKGNESVVAEGEYEGMPINTHWWPLLRISSWERKTISVSATSSRCS